MKGTISFGLRLLPLVAIASLAFVLACGSPEEPEAPRQPAPAAPAAEAPAAMAGEAMDPAKPEQPAPAAMAQNPVAMTAPETVKPTPVAPSGPLIEYEGMMEDPGTPKEGGTVLWAVGNTPSVDWSCHTTFRGGVSNHVYESFFVFDHNRVEAIPMSLASWSLNDAGDQFTFTLRDGQTFHDGTPLESADAIASTERWFGSTHAIAGEVYGLIKPVEHAVVDSKSYTMGMSRPFGLWPVYQAFNGAWIQPEAISNTDPHDCIDTQTQVIGHGPYSYVEWVPGDRVSMERFEDYVPRDEPKNGGGGGKIAYFDRIEAIVVPDHSTRIAGLKTGQIHVVSSDVPGDFKAGLQADPEVEVAVIGPGQPPYLVFNLGTKPFNNKKARQAVLMAADMEAWMTAAYGAGADWRLDGAAFMSDGPWATQVALDKYYKPNGIDLDAAKALMAEAIAEENYDGEVIVLGGNDTQFGRGSSAYTQQLLESLGLKVNRPNVDWATVIGWKNANPEQAGTPGVSHCVKPVQPGATRPGEGWNMYHTRTSPFDPLTLEPASINWSCGWLVNDADYAIPRGKARVDAGVKGALGPLTDKWLSAATLEDARAAIDEMQEFIYDEVRYIQLGAVLGLMAFRNEMAFTPSAGGFNLTGAWFK